MVQSVRNSMIAAVFGLTSMAASATVTKLEKTTIRSKPSATSSAVSVLPAGANLEVVGTSGGFSKVKYKSGGAWQEGYVSTSQLNAGSTDATKAIGTGVSKSTGYSKKDVAAATFMGAPAEAAEGLMEEATSARTTVAAASDISDEFESLPEDVTADVEDTTKAVGETAKDMGTATVNSATSAAAKKKAQLEQATNAKKIRGDADAKVGEANAAIKAKQNEATAKQNEVTGAMNSKRGELESKKADAINSATKSANAKKAELTEAPTKMVNTGRKAMDDKKSELDSQIGAQKNALDAKKGALEDQKDALQGEFENADMSKTAMGAAASVSKKKSSVMAIGDMSVVEELEALQYSKSEFSQTSPFVSEGHLKSKTLK